MTLSALLLSPKKPPPVAVIATYCLPSLPSQVIGAECAPASSLLTHSSFPVRESNARKRLSSGRADEYQAAGGGERSDVGTARLLPIRRQRVGNAEWRLP